MSDPRLAHWFERLEHDGAIVQDNDGFYVYWPADCTGGFLNEYALNSLADYLQEKNRPWKEQIDRYFDQHG